MYGQLNVEDILLYVQLVYRRLPPTFATVFAASPNAVANVSHFTPVPGGVDITVTTPHRRSTDTINGTKNLRKKTSLITGSP
jgi:hypothetical protein